MVFELTDSVKRDILFAMEDQTVHHVLDAQTLTLIPVHDDNVTADDERYYELPEWSSSDGYRMLEAFTDQVRSPLAREELKQVLVGGRGVFRNFKNVLKAYPLVDRQWHYFKQCQMTERLFEWYNALRESWGLEVLSEDLEDDEDVFENDFEFHPYDSSADSETLVRIQKMLEDEYDRQYGAQLGHAFAALTRHTQKLREDTEQFGFVCRTQSDDFAGCIVCSCFLPADKKTALITDFFVLQNYRGLGIGKELLLRTLTAAKERGIHFVLAAQAVVPKHVECMLVQNGFDKVCSGFVANLSTI